VRLGAILVVRAEQQIPAGIEGADGVVRFTEEPLSTAEVVGCSALERTATRYLEAGVEVVSVLIEAAAAKQLREWRQSQWKSKVTFKVVGNVGYAIEQKLSDLARIGLEHSFVQSADLYTETDLKDMASFHQGGRQAVTGAAGSGGPLSFWIVDCLKAAPLRIDRALEESRGHSNIYQVREYVSEIKNSEGLRQFAADILRARCHAAPLGREVKPGLWLGDRVQIHDGARIVAPAYIGRGSTVQADAVVTRCSTIESDCYIDCGSVIEDSSILEGTRVGIWLDICHSVVRGNQMVNLSRGVGVEISDPNVLRSAGSSAISWTDKAAIDRPVDSLIQGDRTIRVENGKTVKSRSVEENRRPSPWRFGAKLIEE
jgi:NDP-sugar pyrophosphorylase family protein